MGDYGNLYADATRLQTGDGQGIVCPSCGGQQFDLQLGGRNGGRIRCAHCEYVVQEGAQANNPAAPAGR